MSNLFLTFFSFELHNGGDWAENFLAEDLHVGLDFGKDSGLDEKSFLPVLLSSNDDCSTFFFSRFYVTHYTLELHRQYFLRRKIIELYIKLRLRNLRSVLGFRTKRITCGVAERFCHGCELDHKIIIYAFLNEDAGASNARLTFYTVSLGFYTA